MLRLQIQSVLTVFEKLEHNIFLFLLTPRRAGMRTDLILDEEEKKTRFRKALEKKQASLEAASSKVESGEEEGKIVPGNLV